ncbi:hypothetical protein ACLB1E_01845 [Escherichia coli]
MKGQDRYFDRAVRRLQQQLRKPAEELGERLLISYSCWAAVRKC